MADVGFDLCVEFGETGEVVVLHENLSSLVHQIDVGTVVDSAIESLGEGETLVADMVLIGACSGIETRVGIVFDGENAENGDVGGQDVVEFES